MGIEPVHEISDVSDVFELETRPAQSHRLTSESHAPLGPLPDRYMLLETIGRGGMGRVLRAYDARLERHVAIKQVRTDLLGTKNQSGLLYEARAMARLSHPNVVGVYDVEDSRSGVMLVMELVCGQTLREWVRRERRWAAIVPRFVEAGQGLAAAHAGGLLHRDFKPSNVLIPDQGMAKVTDFGLATFVCTNGSSDGSEPRSRKPVRPANNPPVIGTPRYMAPEQHLAEPLGPATDQYAFCVALWESLTGRAPFEGEWAELAAKKLAGPPAWPTDVPTPRFIVNAIIRGLAPEPSERWPSMDTLLDALTRRPSRRLHVWAVAAGLLGVFALAEVASAHGSGSDPRRPSIERHPTEPPSGLGTSPRAELEEAIDPTDRLARGLERKSAD